MSRAKRIGPAKLVLGDALEWLDVQRAGSFHAVVTDPPFTTLEYSKIELARRGLGTGIWRLPNAFDGATRQPMPRFTVLSDHDRLALFAFHLSLAPKLYRVLVPGSHVMVASQCLVSYLASQAFAMAGFEVRGQITRVVKTLRGGDRPKFGDKKYREVSVIPRSCVEPWLLFRKPCEGRVIDNLKRYGTGALRRPSEHEPFADLIEAPPARNGERAIAPHPSLKPQRLMRALVHASLPLGRGRVLDPFMGSGSTVAAMVALGYEGVGVELNPKFYRMAVRAVPRLAAFQVSEQSARASPR